MSLCFSNEQVVSFWGGRSPLWIFRWPWVWIEEALLNQQDCRALGLRPSCVVGWQPALISTWLNSYAGGRETLDSRMCFWIRGGGVCCSRLGVPKQTASTGWTRSQELYTQKCLGVSFGFGWSPLEGEYLFTSSHICIDRMMGSCVFFSCIKGCITKASCC